MIRELLPVIVLIGFVLFILYRLSKLVSRVTVWQYEAGLLYRRGKFRNLLGPGVYWILSPVSHIARVDVRHQYYTIVGQEVLSSDSVGLKLSVVCQYQVVDPNVAINSVKSYWEALHLIVQIELREIIGSHPIDELLEKRSSFDATLMARCENQVGELGIKLLSVHIRDIMFPGELKKVFAQVVAARKEGLAALERARGETAALRNLANAAKVMENNPALLNLRLIQALGGSAGNTVVLNLSGAESPLVVKAGSAGNATERKGKEPSAPGTGPAADD